VWNWHISDFVVALVLCCALALAFTCQFCIFVTSQDIVHRWGSNIASKQKQFAQRFFHPRFVVAVILLIGMVVVVDEVGQLVEKWGANCT
jgi:hypothetical protein